MTYSVIIPTMWRSNLENFYKTLKIFDEENQIKEIIIIDNDITLKNKIKEMDKKMLEQPKQTGNIPARFHGSSNLNDDLYR